MNLSSWNRLLLVLFLLEQASKMINTQQRDEIKAELYSLYHKTDASKKLPEFKTNSQQFERNRGVYVREMFHAVIYGQQFKDSKKNKLVNRLRKEYLGIKK